MKIIDILTNLPIGEVVPKKVLAILKRNGLICDYSYHGYLEGQSIYYIDTDGSKEYTFTHIGKKPQDGELGSYSTPFANCDDMVKQGYWKSEIQYKGFTLRPKYLDGCFSPFLIKVAGPTTDGKQVNRSISLGIFQR
jgi:hypothetical protein